LNLLTQALFWAYLTQGTGPPSSPHHNGTERAEMDRGALWCDKQVVPSVCRTCVGNDTAVRAWSEAELPLQIYVSGRSTVYGYKYDVITIDAFVDEDSFCEAAQDIKPWSML